MTALSHDSRRRCVISRGWVPHPELGAEAVLWDVLVMWWSKTKCLRMYVWRCVCCVSGGSVCAVQTWTGTAQCQRRGSRSSPVNHLSQSSVNHLSQQSQHHSGAEFIRALHATRLNFWTLLFCERYGDSDTLYHSSHIMERYFWIWTFRNEKHLKTVTFKTHINWNIPWPMYKLWFCSNVLRSLLKSRYLWTNALLMEERLIITLRSSPEHSDDSLLMFPLIYWTHSLLICRTISVTYTMKDQVSTLLINHTHTHPLSLSLALSHTYTLSLSLSHEHTHSHTYTLTHTQTHICAVQWLLFNSHTIQM